MAIFETFSKRRKKLERAGQVEVYTYDEIPKALRKQVVHIWLESIGPYISASRLYASMDEAPMSNRLWKLIENTLAREMGLYHLGEDHLDPFVQCQHFLLRADIDGVLDLIEVSFRVIDRVVRDMQDYERQESSITQSPDDSIEELNRRFSEHAVGYQFMGGEIVRVDSQYLHTEAVKPALTLLQEQAFAGASEEFLQAHEHYRNGRQKEAINEALKAFESTMKTICDRHKWSHDKGATAKVLIDVLMQKGLIAPDLAAHFGALRATLEAGVPMVRNRVSGHGQGARPVSVPPYVTAYALHLAAANIVLLVEAHKVMP